MSRIPPRSLATLPREPREQFVARVTREIKAVARKKRPASPEPEPKQEKEKTNPLQ